MITTVPIDRYGDEIKIGDWVKVPVEITGLSYVGEVSAMVITIRILPEGRSDSSITLVLQPDRTKGFKPHRTIRNIQPEDIEILGNGREEK